ncbi:MAG: twin-arginine translocation signal domain-containing protein, partial [Verrucomicrobiota bacterium]
MNRRAFLRTSAATGMLLASAPAIIGQSEGKKYKTALIGCGWWGKNILREAIASKNCKVVGLCDVDANGLEI